MNTPMNNDPMSDAAPLSEPGLETNRLTLREGGWVLAVAAFFVVVLLGWTVYRVVINPGERWRGDGENVASYGFDLSTLRGVGLDDIRPTPLPKNALPAMVDPAVCAGSEIDAAHEEQRGSYLITSDRVIGVVHNGAARAYPLQLLNFHEIINDTLGGEAIAVTYSPLCDSAAVYRRTVNGESLELRLSGLVVDSNTLMYDRRPEAEGESLWRQMIGDAVAGPAAENELVLEALPLSMTTWANWLKRHPDTTVVERPGRFIGQYKTNDYWRYFESDKILFPISPTLDADDSRPPKSRVMIIDVGDERRVLHLNEVIDAAGDANAWETTIGGVTVRLEAIDETGAVVRFDGEATHPDASVRTALWFAWFAQQS